MSLERFDYGSLCEIELHVYYPLQLGNWDTEQCPNSLRIPETLNQLLPHMSHVEIQPYFLESSPT